MSDFDIGWVTRPARGEQVCGDHVVHHQTDDRSLLAVLDGLGHGPRAAEAAEAGGDFLRAHADFPLERMIRECDTAIRHTRGVALAVIRIDHARLTLEHAGVGNVELTSISVERVRPVPQPGVVGGRLRKVMVSHHQLHHGDLIVMFSDGISRRLDLDVVARGSARQAAESILHSWGRDHDDASCLVVRV